MPAFFIGAMHFLIRRGLVRIPRSRNAAPESTIENLPKVAFDQALFDDSGAPGHFSTNCPICWEEFDASRQISMTPCQPSGHAFHTHCLSDWLEYARTCPLCR